MLVGRVLVTENNRCLHLLISGCHSSGIELQCTWGVMFMFAGVAACHTRIAHVSFIIICRFGMWNGPVYASSNYEERQDRLVLRAMGYRLGFLPVEFGFPGGNE